MSTLGLALRCDVPAQNFLEKAKLAEEIGYESLWLVESTGRDLATLGGAVGITTKKIRLGSGIISIYSRTPMLIAMTAGTLCEITHGRFTLGLGTGGPPFVTRGHGVPLEKPVTRMKEVISIVRRLLNGEYVNYEGQTVRIKDYRLGFQASTRIPIYIGAMNPEMLRLAGEVADGIILNACPPAYVKLAREYVQAGLERNGRNPEDFDIAAYLICCTSQNKNDALKASKKAIAFYAGSKVYSHMLSLCGFEREASRISQAWQAGDRTRAAEAVTDRMADAISVSGTAMDVKGKISGFIREGVTLPIIYPYGVTELRSGRDLDNAIAAPFS